MLWLICSMYLSNRTGYVKQSTMSLAKVTITHYEGKAYGNHSQ